ncbi:MAG: GNAT family N-acetyltransferase [Anaerolineae bacterium]|nr:GNAT family N-acetyltransferase [Anaerolineae bacterium]
MSEKSPPILISLPDQIESERLIIRPPRAGDGDEVNAAIHESMPELRPWMPWAQVTPTPEETEIVMRQKAAEWLLREDLMLTLWRKDDGVFVGGSGLHRIDWSVPRVEIGYWVRTSLSGCGYITEAVNAITRFALESLDAQRIEIRCDARNIRSAAVAERAGYTLEARLHHDRRDVDGALCDTLIYVMFPGE